MKNIIKITIKYELFFFLFLGEYSKSLGLLGVKVASTRREATKLSHQQVEILKLSAQMFVYDQLFLPSNFTELG